MPATVRLKGDYDREIKEAHGLLESAFKRIMLERARPTTFTADQIGMLGEFYNALGHLEQAVEFIAIAVRDD